MTTVEHHYAASLSWSDPSGTDSFSTFSRDHEVLVEGKERPLEMSAPVWSRGSGAAYCPGELLLTALVSGHMIRFLEVASEVGLVVVEYHDDVEGSVQQGSRGDGRMGYVTLQPRVTVRPGPFATEAQVARLHQRAQSMSVVRSSVAVEVAVQPGPLTVLASEEVAAR